MDEVRLRMSLWIKFTNSIIILEFGHVWHMKHFKMESSKC
jgi:hypothetical protein